MTFTAAPATVYGGRYEWGDHNTPQVRALRLITPGSRVLEIGTGHGGISRLLKRHLSCHVVGVDIDEACAPAASQWCDRFIVGDITNAATLAAIADDYDYILFFDVLEHLADPERTLREFHARLVRPGTRIVVTLPNVLVWHVRLQLLLGRFEYTDSGTLDRTHLRFFTPRTARRLLEDAGFDVVQAGVSWHVPWIGRVRGLALTAEIEDMEPRVLARFPHHGRWVVRALRCQRVVNRCGMIAALDGIGRGAARAFPTLFANHCILVGEAVRGRPTAR